MAHRDLCSEHNVWKVIIVFYQKSGGRGRRNALECNKVKAPLQLAILCRVSKSDQLSDGGRDEDEEEEKEDIQKIEGEEELCDEEGEGSLWW